MSDRVQDPAVHRAIQALPGLPADDDGPVFDAPWEAQAFAMALALHERGVFRWGEWAAALGAEIKAAAASGEPDTNGAYYRHWLAALERLVAEKGIASRDALGSYRDAWQRACERTPHGNPIELTAADFRPGSGGHPAAATP
ncbi:nitrile hydratase accessory protein [Faunimonas sp. B44]|uniref:nitrile hydratase accessory protein n=1 Tax=Faunimonas sp. B44 TaxID=3461493 RepID=UPI0040447CEB